MAVKLLHTIRLDPSDTFVFERAAAPGEPAVPGGFEFVDTDMATLTGKRRQAFRAGFLGLESFGWSTLAVVATVTAAERDEAVEKLASHLLTGHGAPDRQAARTAAEAEIAYAMELAEHPEGTLIALDRQQAPDGSIRERFRTLHAAAARQTAQMPCSAGAFAIVEEAPTGDPAPLDLVDLLDNGRGRGE
jgi:hypothetical protein